MTTSAAKVEAPEKVETIKVVEVQPTDPNLLNHVLLGYRPATAAEIEFPTKSAKIRYLASTGMKTGDIAKLMGIRYQHVRNTLQRPLKKETAV